MIQIDSMILKIRYVQNKDCKDIYDWRNDVNTRKMSNNTELISFEEHQKWFNSSFKNIKRIMLICEDTIQNKKIGIVHFELNKEKALISININPKLRGKGYAKECLSESLKFFIKDFQNCRYIDAQIKKVNVASKKTFQSVGFKLLKQDKELFYYQLIC